MGDRVFFAGLALAVTAMIALALTWPQGLGRPSPGPFGHALAPLPAVRHTGPPPRPGKT